MVLFKKEFNIRDILEEVIGLFNVGLIAKNIKVKTNVDNNIPNILIGDGIRLRQVLSNLYVNSIKFTSQGEICIDVNIEESPLDSIKLRFDASDTGIGIQQESMDKLYKRFSQIDDSNTKVFQGTGLGLAISKKNC